MKLTAREMRTLALACNSLIPPVVRDGPDANFYRRSATDLGIPTAMAKTIEDDLEPGKAAQFRRLLRTLDSRAYRLILDGSITPFSDLEEDQRERLLQTWRDSRVPAKRTGFQALKRLTCFLYYSLEPEGVPNPNWVDIGYPGPTSDIPVPQPVEDRISPIVPTQELELTCDVCVIGAGAGGSVIAKEVSEAGHGVVVLEAGGLETSETYKQSEFQMTQKLFQQNGTASTKDLSFTLLAGRGIGGGTAVNWNTCLKPPPEVLQEWEREFGIDDVTSQRFAADMDEVCQTLKVGSGQSQRNWNNEALWLGCKALGYSEGTDYEVIERNAVRCNERCGFCTYGCIYSCKQSTSMNYLPTAFQRGAKFLFNTKARTVTIEKGRATGVEAEYSGTYRIHVKAKIVVVACGGLETPALLLRSGVKHPRLGKHLTLDPTVSMGGIFAKEVHAWEGPPQTVAVRKFWNLNGTHHGYWIEAAPAHPGLFAFTVPWVDGETHKKFVKENFSRTTATIILLREWGSGTVSVDSHGSPVATYALDNRDKENLIQGMVTAAKILAAAGAVELWSTHNIPVRVGSGKVTETDMDSFASQVRHLGVQSNRINLFSAHLMGSCRMSADPHLGPTRPSGELYDIENIFVGDATVFPTTPAVNPMISIMAMAKRTSNYIKLKLSRS